MQEDTKNTMQERGATIGIGTSINNDLGDLAPHSYEFNGNPHATPEKDDQEPKDRFQIAEENFSKLRQDLKDKKITQDEFASKAQSNMLTIDGVLWSPGARTGTWHKYENGAWVPANPPREEAPTNVEINESRTNKPDEEGGSLQDQEGDVTTLGEAIILSNSSPDTWGSADRQWFDQHRNYIAKAVEQGRFPEHIAKKLGIVGRKDETSSHTDNKESNRGDHSADWYVKIARESLRDPKRRQSFEYWVGDDDSKHKVESKLSLLVKGGMTNAEISELLKISPSGSDQIPQEANEPINNRSTESRGTKKSTPVRPEDMEEVNKSKKTSEKRQKGKDSKSSIGTENGDANNPESATWYLKQMVDQEKKRAEQQIRRDRNLRNYYDAFAAAEFRQTRISVHEFMNNPPLWYEQLDRDLQNAVLTRIFISNAASEKRDGGPIKLEASIQHEGLRLEKRSLQGLWEKMPGWKEAFLTTMKENFILEGGKNGGTLRLSPQAVEYFDKDKHSIEDYYEGLVSRLTNSLNADGRYKSDPFMKDEKDGDVDRRTAARTAVAAVASVRNLIFISGAFEFADKERKLKPDPALISEQFRVFFDPHAKAKDKLIKDPSSKKDLTIQEISGTEEGWGGPIGQLYAERFNYQHSNDFNRPRDPELRAKFLKGESYFPTEMMVSLMDFVKFEAKPDREKPNEEPKEKTLAEATLGILEGAKPDDFGLYNTDTKNINFRDLKGEELWSAYQNTCDSAAQVYKLIVGKAENDYNINKLIDALNLLKTDPRIRKIYTDDNLIHACIMMMAGGPLRFSSSGMANTPEDSYDSTINSLLSDPRLYRLMNDEQNAKSRILKRLHADDTASLAGALKSIFVTGSALVGDRDRIRRAATSEVNKYR